MKRVFKSGLEQVDVGRDPLRGLKKPDLGSRSDYVTGLRAGNG